MGIHSGVVVNPDYHNVRRVRTSFFFHFVFILLDFRFPTEEFLGYKTVIVRLGDCEKVPVDHIVQQWKRFGDAMHPDKLSVNFGPVDGINFVTLVRISGINYLRQ